MEIASSRWDRGAAMHLLEPYVTKLQALLRAKLSESSKNTGDLLANILSKFSLSEIPSGQLFLLYSKFLESKPPTNPVDSLATIVKERARITDDTEQNSHVTDKPRCGINWRLVCAGESDVSLSEKEKVSVSQSKEFSLEYVEKVFGRNREKQQLLYRLMSAKTENIQFSVIAISGMSGIGKTTLAHLVYDDVKVQEYFEVKAWVQVAGEEISLESHQAGVARQIIKNATGLSCPLDSMVELDEMVRDAFLSRRSLIVLDGIESMNTESWLHMKDSWFSVLGLGSKFIITTSNEEIVNIVGGEQFKLGELSQDAGWFLYSSLAFDSKIDKDVGLIIPMARRLAARCRGIPLSLKILGSLMRFEESLIHVLSSPGSMERIMSSVNISSVLYLSLSTLPQDLFMCFSYCGVFPTGYLLDKEKLIRLWISEGFVKQPSSSSLEMKTLEDAGDAYFHQLLCRSFFSDITRNEYGDIVQVRMPRVIHAVTQDIAKILFKDKVGYLAAVDENSHWVSVASPFEEVYKPRRLLTLISSPAKSLYVASTPNLSFLELKLLKSLDLSSSGIRKLSSRVSKLRKLKHLNLSHTMIKKLPKSLTSLVRLQTLDLSGCYYLKVLPKKMSNLAQLRHLDLSQCHSLSCMPSGIGLLSFLNSMPLFVLGQTDTKCAGLGDLRNLNELRGRLNITNLENVKEISEAQAADLKNKRLHHLGLSWSHNVEECFSVLQWLRPNSQLISLDLTGYGSFGFPSWMPKLYSLVKLSINECRSTTLPTLGELPFLKELLLTGLPNVRSIGQEFYGDGIAYCFPSLEKLKLHGIPKLYNWSSATYGRVVFRRLKTLSIQGCPQLQTLPPLPSVTELVLWSTHSKILPLVTRIRSLSSLLIKDMESGEFFAGLNTSSSIKKLILVNSTDLVDVTSHHIRNFTALEHLSVLHCLMLRTVTFSAHVYLQKLNIVDCENLKHISLAIENITLTELIIEDCPQLESISHFAAGLRKLVIRNCRLFSILPQEIRKLKALEYLFISECPPLEYYLNEDLRHTSHVPIVILGDRQIVDKKDKSTSMESHTTISEPYKSNQSPSNSEREILSPR